MFEWRVEEMALMNERGHIFVGKEKIYGCETEVSREDKIAFVDSMQDGKLSYLLGLIEKFKQEESSLPHNRYSVKTVSLKAWIKRNDKKYKFPIIDCSYYHGQYTILGSKRYIWSESKESKGSYDTYDDLVDECFHRQLKKCEDDERAYFASIDEYSILSERVINLSERFDTTFGVPLSMRGNGNITVESNDGGEGRKITLAELRFLILQYEKLEAFVSVLTSETQIV